MMCLKSDSFMESSRDLLTNIQSLERIENKKVPKSLKYVNFKSFT